MKTHPVNHHQSSSIFIIKPSNRAVLLSGHRAYYRVIVLIFVFCQVIVPALGRHRLFSGALLVSPTNWENNKNSLGYFIYSLPGVYGSSNCPLPILVAPFCLSIYYWLAISDAGGLEKIEVRWAWNDEPLSAAKEQHEGRVKVWNTAEIDVYSALDVIILVDLPSASASQFLYRTSQHPYSHCQHQQARLFRNLLHLLISSQGSIRNSYLHAKNRPCQKINRSYDRQGKICKNFI